MKNNLNLKGGIIEMKKIILINSLVLVLVGLNILPILAQEKQLTASQILGKVDEVENAPADQTMRTKIILIDKEGKEKEREIIDYRKGANRSIAKFISPADQKGIGFLSLPNDVMYIYLPAFKKTRRIASHIKNSKFAGTDFTYEDMEAKKYSEKWLPGLLKTEDNHYVLQLKPKESTKSDYSKQIMWIRTDNFFPVKIEFYDKSAKLRKIMTREKIEQINGYWVSKESQMEDLKEEHKTKIVLEDIKFDSGLSDEIFTERYLSR